MIHWHTTCAGLGLGFYICWCLVGLAGAVELVGGQTQNSRTVWPDGSMSIYLSVMQDGLYHSLNISWIHLGES